MDIREVNKPDSLFARQTDSINYADLITQLIQSATLSIAANLARRQQYQQAERMVLPLSVGASPNIEALDLLAKIYAQQGKIEDAMSMWEKASVQDPQNKRFKNALNDCRNIHSNSSAKKDWSPLRRIFLAINIIFIIAMAVFLTIILSIK